VPEVWHCAQCRRSHVHVSAPARDGPAPGAQISKECNVTLLDFLDKHFFGLAVLLLFHYDAKDRGG
jgi:uncharacterized protein YbjT (DUF2867 family)